MTPLEQTRRELVERFRGVNRLSASARPMMRGDGDVVSGWENRLQSAIANITGVLAEQHRTMARPGSGQKARARGHE